jgi:hypothetical protein
MFAGEGFSQGGWTFLVSGDIGVIGVSVHHGEGLRGWKLEAE